MTHVNSGTKVSLVIKKHDSKTWDDCYDMLMTNDRHLVYSRIAYDDEMTITAYTSKEQFAALHKTFMGSFQDCIPTLESETLPPLEMMVKIIWTSQMMSALFWKLLAKIYLAEMDKADTDGQVSILAHKAKIAHNQLSMTECLLEVAGEPIIKFL